MQPSAVLRVFKCVGCRTPWPDAGGSWWWPESLTLTHSDHLTSDISSLSFVTLHVFYISLPLASPRALHVISNQRMMMRGGKIVSHWLQLDLATLLLSQSPLDGGLVRPRGGHTQHQQTMSMSARCIVLFSWYLTRKGSRRTRNARGGCKVWRLRLVALWENILLETEVWMLMWWISLRGAGALSSWSLWHRPRGLFTSARSAASL